MKYLFDDNAKFTKEALDLNDEARYVLKSIFKKYVDMGYSSREVSHVILGSVNELEIMSVLGINK